MAVRSTLMIGAGIAVAGLGLVGAGAGATFTTQVSTQTSISSGGVSLSLNGNTGSGTNIGLDGTNLGSHFAPIATNLRLKNTGTLDMAATYLNLTATGCHGGPGAPLAKALRVKLTDATNQQLVYDGALCSFATSGVQTHTGVGAQLPRPLKADEMINYRLVIQPADAAEGLPNAAHYASTSLKLVFTGFDY